jgi:putative lipoic acid-binding regulatory protein
MILDSNNKQRPEIEYPCEWSYKVIGKDVDKILEAIEDASSGLKYDVTPSNISRNGNYFSLNFKIEVPSEFVRDLIYQKLGKNSHIKMVL